MSLKFSKDYLKADDLWVYTISLDDGQELVINEYEFKKLKELVNSMK